ncbi:HNH endonuclease [Flavobacterium sp. FlaQc-50]|jgi:putative restriction endonuclease|uniref:HNH endonuclease n=1 Tax=unclassified Flavobacterium TaxID=196869 RepID=UPI003756CEEB
MPKLENTTSYWALKSVSDEEQSYKSNDGYADEFKIKYVYDNSVPNHKQIKTGDIVAIVNKKEVLGLAKISRIILNDSTKDRRRCPICGNTNYEERKTKLPKFRCNQGHEFEEPISEIVNVVRYQAFYGSTFIIPKEKVQVSKLRPYFDKKYNRNMSMQSLSESFFEDYFKTEIEQLKTELSYPNAEDSENYLSEILSDDYFPRENDERVKVYKSIIQRRGQKKFRDEVREMYDNKCVITGCEILDILEAAHINPYKGEKDNHATNGLLLRADIHTLFDLDLIGIEPTELKVYLSKTIKKDGYQVLENKSLQLILKHKRPSKEALNLRWEKFSKNNNL